MEKIPKTNNVLAFCVKNYPFFPSVVYIYNGFAVTLVSFDKISKYKMFLFTSLILKRKQYLERSKRG